MHYLEVHDLMPKFQLTVTSESDSQRRWQYQDWFLTSDDSGHVILFSVWEHSESVEHSILLTCLNTSYGHLWTGSNSFWMGRIQWRPCAPPTQLGCKFHMASDRAGVLDPFCIYSDLAHHCHQSSACPQQRNISSGIPWLEYASCHLWPGCVMNDKMCIGLWIINSWRVLYICFVTLH